MHETHEKLLSKVPLSRRCHTKPVVQALVLIFLMISIGCDSLSKQELSFGATDTSSKRKQPSIFSEDDRTLYMSAPEELQRLIRQSSVALVSKSKFNVEPNGTLSVTLSSLQDDFGVCSTERFADLPTLSSCSGTLVGEDLVMTAGHCVLNHAQCANQNFVFDYYLNENEQISFHTNSIYECKEIIATHFDESGWDYSLIRLDRKVDSSRRPINIASRRVRSGDKVTVVGYPSGLPAIVDSSGSVSPKNSTDITFDAYIDIFAGNSGSGIYNKDLELVGVLSMGFKDYQQYGEECTRAIRYSANGLGAVVVRADKIREELCSKLVHLSLCQDFDHGHQDTRGESSYHKDTYQDDSSQNENTVGTPGAMDWYEDSSTSEHSEQVDSSDSDGSEWYPEEMHSTGEHSSTVQPQEGQWLCNPSQYNDGNSCDCDCGAYDPDCDNPQLETLGCAKGEACNLDGSCTMPAYAPETWSCDPDYYGAFDGCDCGCGIPDPDCSFPTEPRIGC